jgi:hypothetical protein
VARHTFARRLAAVTLPTLLATVVLTGSAVARPSTVRFTVAPSRALQGSVVSVAVSVRPAGARCSLNVRYADGATETTLKPAKAVNGRASWRWRVPASAGAGAARAAVRCGSAGSATRSLIVVGAIAAPKVSVQQDGFSVRVRPSSAGISYGLILQNDSAQLDALEVSVQVNFVDAANRVVGTSTDKIEVVGSQSTFALGGYASFPAAAIVQRLETVILVGGHRPKAVRVPAQANMRIFPNQFEPAWTGSIEGELINDHVQLFLRRASLSAVLFDAAGAIVGGTSGSANALLPPGAREFYKLTSGLNNVPIEKAVSAVLSIEPTYSQV